MHCLVQQDVTLRFILQVGWTSNNHGGGYVRISLVPLAQEANAEVFKQNVMKFACYGHDTRPDKTLNGDCVHPCDGRPGCEFQSGRQRTSGSK